MNSYELSRAWFDFSFENPEKISPSHAAIYFFAIEHNNRLGWREKFGFPTQMACDAIGINKPQTFIKYFNDLVDWGFIRVIERSKNQYSANIISLKSAKPKNGKALDKAIVKHAAKQVKSTRQSNSPINKPKNQRTNKQVYREFDHLSMSVEEAEKLIKKFSKQKLDDVLDDIENYRKKDNYASLYLTANNWLKKREPKKITFAEFSAATMSQLNKIQ